MLANSVIREWKDMVDALQWSTHTPNEEWRT